MSEEYPLNQEEYKAIYSRVPRLCVDLVIKAPQGLVLSLRARQSWHGQWHLPGGGMFYQETVEQAAKRIAKKELNIEIVVEHMLGYLEYPSEQKEVGFGQSVSIALLCSTAATEFVPDADASEVRMFADLPEHMLAEQKQFLEQHPDWR